MLYAPTKEWRFECDQMHEEYGFSCCSEELRVSARNSEDAIKKGKEAGWLIRLDGVTFCSQCAKNPNW